MYVTGQNKIKVDSQLPLSSSPYLPIIMARGQRKLRINIG